MRELFIAVEKHIAEELGLESVRQSIKDQYLLRVKDIVHLEGNTTDEKAERINGHVLDSNEATRFLQGKLKLNKRIIEYEATAHAKDNANI